MCFKALRTRTGRITTKVQTEKMNKIELIYLVRRYVPRGAWESEEEGGLRRELRARKTSPAAAIIVSGGNGDIELLTRGNSGRKWTEQPRMLAGGEEKWAHRWNTVKRSLYPWEGRKFQSACRPSTRTRSRRHEARLQCCCGTDRNFIMHHAHKILTHALL